MSEKINTPKLEQPEFNETKLDQTPATELAPTPELLERKSPEKLSNDREIESAKHEAMEIAKAQKVEKATPSPAKTERNKQPSKPTKAELDASFTRAMATIQEDMSPASRTFSKIIHNPAVDKISNVAGNTIARPNLILAGALGTLILCTAIYFIAKFYGYSLSGSEAIATFFLGWLIGAIVEFARVGMLQKSK